MRSAELIAAGAERILRVEFVWKGDRFGHVLSSVSAEGVPTLLLESVEGSATDDWPPSPPLQSLRMEELAVGREAALLVGMAGRSHWSASVEPVVGEAALVFDVACRHAAGAGWLGSRYRQLPQSAEQLKAEAELGRVITSGLEILIEPVGIPERGGTARWKFAIRLISADAGSKART